MEKEMMENKDILIDNIDKIHTTQIGADRIIKNLKIDVDDVTEYCIKKILDKNCRISKNGKNWYCRTGDIQITVNSSSYTIITCHIL